MTKRGCNLMADGRPIIGLTSIQLAGLVLSIEPKALIIGAHVWTPWFSLYGSMSGFDSIEEAFGPFAKHMYAVETGLSSSPAMNWRIAELDNRAIVSFSDAHSGAKLGREATVFELSELSYDTIYQAISQLSVCRSQFSDKGLSGSQLTGQPKPNEQEAENRQQKTDNRIAYTIEFYPEEGKYHYTGHRTCNVRRSPEETKDKGTTCPVCGKPLTIGVMHRVEELANRSEEDLQLSRIRYQWSEEGLSAVIQSETETPTGGARGSGTRLQTTGNQIQMIMSKSFPHRPPFVMLVPLQEILREALGCPLASPKVQALYHRLTDQFGSEFAVLLTARLSDIARSAGERVAVGIEKVRYGDIYIDPGYDGVFGMVNIWKEGEQPPALHPDGEQLTMF